MPFDGITFEGDLVSPFQGFNFFGAAGPRALPWAVMLGRLQRGGDQEDARYSRCGTLGIFDRRFAECPGAGLPGSCHNKWHRDIQRVVGVA